MSTAGRRATFARMERTMAPACADVVRSKIGHLANVKPATPLMKLPHGVRQFAYHCLFEDTGLAIRNATAKSVSALFS